MIIILTFFSFRTVNKIRSNGVNDSKFHCEILIFLNQGGFISFQGTFIRGFIQGTLSLEVVGLDAIWFHPAKRKLVVGIFHRSFFNALKQSFLVFFKSSLFFDWVLSTNSRHSRETICIICIIRSVIIVYIISEWSLFRLVSIKSLPIWLCFITSIRCARFSSWQWILCTQNRLLEIISLP